jgi:hypothetical protein
MSSGSAATSFRHLWRLKGGFIIFGSMASAGLLAVRVAAHV